MGISLRRRFRILKRDSFRCRYCGAAASDGVELHVDHVQPRALGGADDDRNLVTACVDCNRGKAASPPEWQPCKHWLIEFQRGYRDLSEGGEWASHNLFRDWMTRAREYFGVTELTDEQRDLAASRYRSDPERQRLIEFWGPEGIGSASCL